MLLNFPLHIFLGIFKEITKYSLNTRQLAVFVCSAACHTADIHLVSLLITACPQIPVTQAATTPFVPLYLNLDTSLSLNFSQSKQEDIVIFKLF